MPPKRKYDNAGTDVDDQADAIAELEAGTSGGIPESQTTPAIGAPATEGDDDWEKAEALAAELAGDVDPEPIDRTAQPHLAKLTDAELEATVDQWVDAPEPEPEAAADLAPAPAPAASSSELGFSARDEYRGILRELGARRTALADEVGALELELYAAIRGARAAGVPKQVIAKDAGVARQTVYNVLGKGVL